MSLGVPVSYDWCTVGQPEDQPLHLPERLPHIRKEMVKTQARLKDSFFVAHSGSLHRETRRFGGHHELDEAMKVKFREEAQVAWCKLQQTNNRLLKSKCQSQ